MSRLNRLTLREQTALLQAIDRAFPGTTRRQIAEAAGCDCTLVSKWTTEGEDGRELKASEKERLADVFGWDVIYGGHLRAAGWDVVPRTAAPAASPLQGAVGLVGSASILLATAHEAARDGRYDADERAALRDQALDLRKLVNSLLAAVE